MRNANLAGSVFQSPIQSTTPHSPRHVSSRVRHFRRAAPEQTPDALEQVLTGRREVTVVLSIWPSHFAMISRRSEKRQTKDLLKHKFKRIGFGIWSQGTVINHLSIAFSSATVCHSQRGHDDVDGEGGDGDEPLQPRHLPRGHRAGAAQLSRLMSGSFRNWSSFTIFTLL